MEITVRSGDYNDLKFIYKLVHELAEFEKAGDQVTIDLSYYQEQFEAGLFSFLVAEKNDNIIGTCIFYDTFSTWKGKMIYLEDFIVSQSHRSQGIGQMLFDAFLAYAKSVQATMVKWQVLDWNEQATKFYRKNHAIIEKNWWNGKIIFGQT